MVGYVYLEHFCFKDFCMPPVCSFLFFGFVPTELEAVLGGEFRAKLAE